MEKDLANSKHIISKVWVYMDVTKYDNNYNSLSTL